MTGFHQDTAQQPLNDQDDVLALTQELQLLYEKASCMTRGTV